MSDNLIRNQYLSAMGIDVWVSRESTTPEYLENRETKLNTEIKSITPDIATLDWNALQNEVNQCQLCELCQTRKNSLFGSGNKQAELFIIGSIPNNEEDECGEVFSGLEGKLLENMLSTLKLSRQDVFTTTLVKCKSKNHREFSETEMQKCLPYIERQIELLKPKVLILFGEQTAQFILKTQNKMSALNSSIHNYSDTGILVIVIEHPEQMLTSGADKKQAWQALMKIKTVLTPKN